ncbi:MAG: leucine-rich repeat domain-containing protein [Oscillospiraceae bacterium]|nr:leucine-rich repeat domain-containing protein [Oscillospiraceae bacterium]
MKTLKKTWIFLLLVCLAALFSTTALADVPQPASGTCGDNLTWEWKYPVLTISGTGDMEDYSATLLGGYNGYLTTSAPWNYLLWVATTIIIEDGVTSIGDYAFYDPYYHNLTTVTLGDDITSIGDHAFACCSELTEIEIPDGVISIGNSAFSGCSELSSVTIPNSVTSIGSGAFEMCSSLTSITIPNSVTSIGSGAFEMCSNLTSYC